MAVQAQYPSDVFEELLMLHRPRNDVSEELVMLHGGTVLSDHHPKSELTCIASGSKKRCRDAPSSMVLSQPNQGIPHQFQHPNLGTFPARTAANCVSFPSDLRHPPSLEQSRLYGSTGTSTSGRAGDVSTSAPVASPIAQYLVSHICQQNVEIDALVRLQTERLRSGLEELNKSNCRTLLSALEHQVAKRLKEKEMELESVTRRNAELEVKVRQLNAESQIWFNVAKNNESVVSTLRTNLEQVLRNAVATAAAPPAEEGYGDSDGAPFPADDAQSCCFKEEATTRREKEELRSARACRVCGEREVCVLLLPCRHLCLCKECESRTDKCPICHCTQNASLQIFLS